MACLALGSPAQAANVPFRLCFRDSVTGLAVTPGSVRIDNQEFANRLDGDGQLKITVAEGTYAITVKADGYRIMNTRQVATPVDTPLNILHLDPVNPPKDSHPKALRSLAQWKGSMITGYIGDEETGRPIEGVEVLASSGAGSMTNADGFFLVSIALENGRAVPGDDAARVFTKVGLSVSKAGYVSQQWSDVVVSSGDAQILRIRLSRGTGTSYTDVKSQRGRLQATMFDGVAAAKDTQAAPVAALAAPQGQIQAAAQAAPSTIRVGRGCPTKLTCATVETMSIETYTKHVLPAEWYGSWNADSLKAGAIAIRSYGAWHVYNPLTATYDICDTSACQVYKDSTAASTNAAVDATAGMYIVDSSGNIARAEYSAENNNSGTCGDCYTVNNPSDGICLSDSVCCGATLNGHGRGMCQWGSQRWTLSPHNKTYDWICDHYYAAYNWTLQNLAIPTIDQQPLPQNVCSGGTATFNIVASGPGTLTYQWQKDSGNITNGGHYSGATTATLTVSSADSGDVAAYRCVVTASGGSVTSDAANLTLDVATSIAQDPQPQSICPTQTATFTVTAGGDGPFSYQWQKDGSNLSEGGHYAGTTTSALTISSADEGDLGQYRCRVTNCGTATSSEAALTFGGPEFAKVDYDHDHDVDQADFAHLQECLSGTAIPQEDEDCANTLLDDNIWVDGDDFDIFKECYSGPNLAPDTCCYIEP